MAIIERNVLLNTRGINRCLKRRPLAKKAVATTIPYYVWEAHRIPSPKSEYLFASSIGRRWRFDFAWPDKKVAVEIEGGAFTNGRHTRGKGYLEDCDKYNHAVLLGWKVLRFPPYKGILHPEAFEMIRKVLIVEFKVSTIVTRNHTIKLTGGNLSHES